MADKERLDLGSKENTGQFDWNASTSANISSAEGLLHDAVTDEAKKYSDQSGLSEKDIELLESLSPAALELALPKLPELRAENLARLQMQSPNRLYFYWSLKTDPFRQLSQLTNNAAQGYSLVLRLIDQTSESTNIYPIDRQGFRWFDVKADTAYKVEIGLYAVNRPFIRILFSNTVKTPRKSPSDQLPDSAEWHIPAAKFAEVLKISGFAKDAFDVAVAGDDLAEAKLLSYSALTEYTGVKNVIDADIDPADIRFALYGIASGLKLEEIRWQIDPTLYELLIQHGKDDAEKALDALRSGLNIETDEFLEEEVESAVFGSSSVNFPRRVRSRARFTETQTFSSHSFK